MENEIRVTGDWSIFGVSQKIPQLLEQLKGLVSGKPAVIDLSELEEIDVSGWQLLSIWIRHCRRLGLEPVLVNLHEDLRRRISLLGFASEFTIADQSGEAA